MGEKWLGGTCGSRDGSEFQGWRARSGAGAGGKVRKGEDGGPSRVAEGNVNPRAGTAIFLFLVTHKCTGHPERGERERLDRGQSREKEAEAEILAVAGGGAEGAE